MTKPFGNPGNVWIGFILWKLWTIVAIVGTLLQTGCATIDEPSTDDDVIVPVDPAPPAVEPADPEPWCGLEAELEETETPDFADPWTTGQPFEVDGFVAYLDVVHETDWMGLELHAFDENGMHWAYMLSSFIFTESAVAGDYWVSDVLIEDGLVHVLYSLTTWSSDGQAVDRLMRLSTIDLRHGLTGHAHLWKIFDEMYRLYQLAVDGAAVSLVKAASSSSARRRRSPGNRHGTSATSPRSRPRTAC
jgi:hypothetical protein